MNKKISRTVIVCLFFVIYTLTFITTAFASNIDESNTMHRITRFGVSGNWFFLGGDNEFRGKKAKTRQEVEQMETDVMHSNYILISTQYSNVPIEDIRIFARSRAFWFTDYLDETSYEWLSGKVRVYVYKPSYDDYMEYAKYGTTKNTIPADEISSSTVVIDFYTIETVERIGTEMPYINDMIPDYVESSYVKIISPVDCKVRMLHGSSQRVYNLYVKRDTPLLVKVVAGCYHINAVGDRSIPDNMHGSGEDTLPYNNNIQLDEGVWTRDNPYIVDLTKLVVKYKIPDDNIDGKPNYNIDKGEGEQEKFKDVPNEEITVVLPPDEDEKKLKFTWKTILWLILIAFVVLGVVGIIRGILSPDEEESEENTDDD